MIIAPMFSGRRPLAVGLVILATIGYVIFHTKTHDAEALRAATEYLLAGRTHWITFQNRLLSAWIIEGVRVTLGASWVHAFWSLVAATMAGGAFVLLWRSWRDTGSSRRGLIQGGVCFLLAVLFNHFWSYPWDFTGALLFLLLIAWAEDNFKRLSDMRSGYLAGLLILLAANRESSLIIILSLVATVAIGGFYEKRLRTAAVTVAVLGFAGVVNVMGVVWVRTTLFVSSTRPAGVDGPETEIGNFLQLRANWLIFKSMFHDWYSFAATVVTAGLAILSLIMLRSIIRDFLGPRELPLGRIFTYSIFGLGALVIPVFGYASELRVYFEHIPLIVLLLIPASIKSRKKTSYLDS